MTKWLLLLCVLTCNVNDTVSERFSPPLGYKRVGAPAGSFAQFLRQLPLKPKGSAVLYYDGTPKANDGVYAAVIDLPIGKRDLHQCADAVMRLRADYFFSQGRYDEIHFNFTNGFRADYSRWRKGERIAVKGNRVSWQKTAQPSDSRGSYWKYLEAVFMYAGTASLSKELKSVPLSDLAPGDVFIKGGFPGHAVIVLDVAINTSGRKMFLLAQSYMPAQEAQVLYNPQSKTGSAWYPDDFGETLVTPEWTFRSTDLKRF
ncbi:MULTISPECIES: DUF4846 domain-containing protein [unclassified Flavobacterium]|uniref:DUF4846 domain-containing protein n=1 Tax=unclassified Flavobacterium TaxID=196869 RepID=UPI001F143A57|nr:MULTISPECIES: DUF4846 domain-containing protein [unclassified Flavobacterium]UMY64632.1 DUF4846 domain-containing protein [Flavobacterium sp. HJ-32-4]